MRHVIVRSRSDGVVELTPRLAPLDAGDRAILIVTVLLVTGGLFMCGLLPPGVAVAMAASCVAGEVFLTVKAVGLALLRPAAKVLEVGQFELRRGR
jgi:hypothetical protein